MSSSSEKAPSITLTCSMLFQYLKEKGQLGDLKSLEKQYPIVNSGEILRHMAQQQPMSFFPVMEKPRSAAPVATRGFKSMDLFPQQAGFGESTVKKASPAEPKKAQMTIFYNGQVVVFDDLPAEKAKEVMLMASKESSKNHQMGHVAAPVKTNTTTIFGTQFGSAPISPVTAPVAPSSNSFPKFGNQVIQQQEITIKPTPTRPIINDIPMQRKASLQRFLAKRKDRMNNLAPYQLMSPGSSASAKSAADGKSWLGLAALQTQ